MNYIKTANALVWAHDAAAGDYLCRYDDVYETPDERESDDGSRCGFDDQDLDAIGEILRRRDLQLIADDRGLLAEAR